MEHDKQTDWRNLASISWYVVKREIEMSNGNTNGTVENFGMTVDVAQPSIANGHATKFVQKRTYNGNVAKYKEAVKAFGTATDIKSATIAKSEVEKRAEWFAGKGIKPNRGEKRAKVAERQAKVAEVSATDHAANADARLAAERADKRARLLADGQRMLAGNRDTVFGKRSYTNMQEKMYVSADIREFVREFAPSMLYGLDRLYLDNAIRDGVGFHAIFYTVEQIERDDNTPRIVKRWFVFSGDGKGNAICQLANVTRNEVNSFFYGMVAHEIEPNLIATPDGAIVNVGLKTFVSTLLAG